MTELVVLGVIAVAALVVAYLMARHANEAASEQIETYLLHVEKLEKWIETERGDRAVAMKDERESFEQAKKAFYGTIEGLRRRATDAENTVLTQNQQIHALLTERTQSIQEVPTQPPQPRNGLGRARLAREPVPTPIHDDNVEGTGDGGTG